MWKMIATVLAVTDTGSISTSMVATDFEAKVACDQTAELFSGTDSKTVVVEGRTTRIIIRATAKCVHNPMEQREVSGLPPPVHGAINGFLRELGQMR